MNSKKSIFITGAASGIGRATALLFAEKGWYTGLFDIDETALAELAEKMGENACFKRLDVSSSEDVKEAVDYFSNRTEGKMDVLFNCAGILRMGPFEDIELEEQIRTVNINFTGVINGIYAAFSVLRKTAGSRIVSMCSGSAISGVPDLATYSASKFAVRGLTEALNIEFERHGIAVCDIMVPYVQTPMLDQERQAASIEKLGVNLRPEQVAALVWKAAHGNKVHWSVNLRLARFIGLMPPFLKRSLIKAKAWEDKP
ncbi:MAG: SDR family oxidoreductase [Proteobacteria bacterium]|nr:SDR family oxidoreductase [Pseudomonadota bacterium]